MALEEELLRDLINKVSDLNASINNGIRDEVHEIKKWIKQRPPVCPFEKRKENLPRKRFIVYLLVSIPVFIGGVWSFVDKVWTTLKGLFS